MSSSTATINSARDGHRLVKVAAGLLLAHVAVVTFIEANILAEGSRLVVPMAIFGVIALGLAVGLFARPSRVLAIVAAVVMVVDLIGSWPHEVANVASSDALKSVTGVVALLVIAGAIVAAAAAAATWRNVRVGG